MAALAPALSQARNLWLITRFELHRLFASPRGWFALSAFVIIWYVLLRYPIFQASAGMQDPEILRIFSGIFGMAGMYNILNWPLPELSAYWVMCVGLLPMCTLFFAADQTSSDRSRGTLRFLMLRTSRDSVFFGRFLGQMLIQSILISLSIAATLAMAWWRLGSLSAAALEAALIMVINLVVIIAPFTALMAMCSALVKSSRMAISLAVVGSGVVLGVLGWVAWYLPMVRELMAFVPGAQISQVLSKAGWSTLQSSGLPLAQTAVFLLIGRQIMQGKSL
jgi:hypothetical protein